MGSVTPATADAGGGFSLSLVMVDANFTQRLRGAAFITMTVLGTSACAHIDVAPRVLAQAPDIGSCGGISVAVDGRALASTGNGGYAYPEVTCVETDQTMTALAALDDAEVTPTRASEDVSALCRVQGDPFDGLAIAEPGGGLYFETCTSTPPDFARWVVWSKSGDDDWSDKNQDITTLELAPGEALALVFAYDGEPSTPTF